MSKVGNKYIITIKNETEIDGKMKYWVAGFENMCVDDNVLNKLEMYKEASQNHVEAGDIVELREHGTTGYLVTRVEYDNSCKLVLHLININNGTVQTCRSKFRVVSDINENPDCLRNLFNLNQSDF